MSHTIASSKQNKLIFIFPVCIDIQIKARFWDLVFLGYSTVLGLNNKFMEQFDINDLRQMSISVKHLTKFCCKMVYKGIDCLEKSLLLKYLYCSHRVLLFSDILTFMNELDIVLYKNTFLMKKINELDLKNIYFFKVFINIV